MKNENINVNGFWTEVHQKRSLNTIILMIGLAESLDDINVILRK